MDLVESDNGSSWL